MLLSIAVSMLRALTSTKSHMKDGEALLFLLPCPFSPSNFQQVAFLDELHLEDSVALDFCLKCIVVAVVF